MSEGLNEYVAASVSEIMGERVSERMSGRECELERVSVRECELATV
jgi:hypothetical protein